MTTLKDIAKQTGRSVSTVSVILRGEAERFGIRASTAETVRRTAHRMGYIRNDCARTMVCGKSSVLGFVGGCSSAEYSGRLLFGALEKASVRGYSLRVFRQEEKNREEELFRTLRSQQIGGVLLSGDLEHDNMRRLIEVCSAGGIRCATVNHANRVDGIGVSSDDAAGMGELIGRLIEQGHRKIAFLGARSESDYARNRLRGYRAGMRKQKLPAACFYSSELDRTLTLADWVKQKFTAVVCDTDFAAAHLLQQAYRQEIRVPETISVTGFAGMQVADFAAAPLTTVAQDFEGMGGTAAELLISLLTGKLDLPRGQTRNIKIPARVIFQQTTKGM